MSKSDFDKIQAKYEKALKNRNSHVYKFVNGEEITIVINDLYQVWRVSEKLGRTIYALEVDRKAG